MIDVTKRRARGVKYNRQRRDATKAMIAEAKSVPCADCNKTFPPCCMDFDHVIGEKIDDISRLARYGYDSSKLLREIEKCEVVCANCHRIRTFDQMVQRERTRANSPPPLLVAERPALPPNTFRYRIGVDGG
jgi:NADPH-dependent glutamate synthase beta subunit-like oxidoreductase